MSGQGTPIDEAKLNAFVGKIVTEVSAAASGALVLLGDKLGFYKALAEHGPLTSAELAGKVDKAELRLFRCTRRPVLLPRPPRRAAAVV